MSVVIYKDPSERIKLSGEDYLFIYANGIKVKPDLSYIGLNGISISNPDEGRDNLLLKATLNFSNYNELKIRLSSSQISSPVQSSLFFFGDYNDILINSSAGNGGTEYNIIDNKEYYFFIPFGATFDEIIPSPDRVEIDCNCKRGSGSCSEAVMSGNVSCITNSGCNRCKMKIVVFRDQTMLPIEGGGLLIRTNTVQRFKFD